MKTDRDVHQRTANLRQGRSYSRPSVSQPRRCLRIALLSSCLAIAGCSRTGEQSTVAEVCRIDDGTLVSVEGFLQLPNFLEANMDPETEAAIYELVLAEQPDSKSPSIKTRISGTRDNKPNRI